MNDIIKAATRSAWRSTGLALRSKLALSIRHQGKTYAITRHDRPDGEYTVFRDAVNRLPVSQPVVLVVGFRLKALHSNRLLHWCFRRACILTTPFWSGLDGFKEKLWMSDRLTNNYLGIYEWDRRDAALSYVNKLLKVLKPLSIRGTVWYEVHTYNFENFLADRVTLPFHAGDKRLQPSFTMISEGTHHA